jgi:hypothetical protein
MMLLAFAFAVHSRISWQLLLDSLMDWNGEIMPKLPLFE